MNDEGIKNLIYAILERACIDYMRALCGCGYEQRRCQYVIKECEQFFRSDWFEYMTDLDAEYLIKVLRGKRNGR